MPKLGFIGGSGIYGIDALQDSEWVSVETAWGRPSDDILIGRIGGMEMAFLPRHGRGHRIPPSEVPYPANIAAMKTLGITDLVSISACGSFREDYAPGDFVIVDQFIDRTSARTKSFFTHGCTGHVSIAHPTCPRLGAVCLQAASELGIQVHNGGTYLAMEGPQFSTLAESNLYRSWGCDVIGMTNMPEAKLAREAEICFATVAMVTDYDSWHPDHGEIDISKVIATLVANSESAKRLVQRIAGEMRNGRGICQHGCDRSLEYAVITAPDQRDPELVEKLSVIAGRVLKC
ncbi:MAG: S-methyl-5'-thioadenosine phosphorylase [Rhodobacteraceae bacterium]|nr:S-methyl-5'-thioadenosine phosphorylase [Paracoccaceae bacterium]